jgi:hypothetical protein
MKISKIFTGLVVCGALIFPGALSSSAQEIDPLVAPESINYSTEQETGIIQYSSKIPNTLAVFKGFNSFQGQTVYHMEYGIGNAAGTLYHGYLTFQYQDKLHYYYQGTLTKKN